jgi:hypothetical protein
MDGSVRLSATDRKPLFQVYRRGSDSERRLRAHILMVLDDRIAWTLIGSVLFAGCATVT